MKAIRVKLGAVDADKIDGVIEKLNSYDDTVATKVATNELFVAADDTDAIQYAVCILELRLQRELSIQYVK